MMIEIGAQISLITSHWVPLIIRGPKLTNLSQMKYWQYIYRQALSYKPNFVIACSSGK
jgi:hypothetical protein